LVRELEFSGSEFVPGVKKKYKGFPEGKPQKPWGTMTRLNFSRDPAVIRPGFIAGKAGIRNVLKLRH
jgi:hypothetical protein